MDLDRWFDAIRDHPITKTLEKNRMSNPDGMSLGARRVRESFNPSLSTTVDKIKRYTADLIDLCEEIKLNQASTVDDAGELVRLVSLAQTHYEDAAMWAVKAATTPKRSTA